jgi:hypothetical protein
MEHFVAKDVFDVAIVVTEDVDCAITGVVYAVKGGETELESDPSRGHACIPPRADWGGS